MRHYLLLPSALFLVVGCNRPQAEPSTITPTTPDATMDAKTALELDCAFCAQPSFVRTCEIARGISTTLYWNATDAGVDNVGLFVVDDAGQDSSFAQQPPRGSLITGPWLKPGLTFKLKAPDGTVLQTLVIDGKEC